MKFEEIAYYKPMFIEKEDGSDPDEWDIEDHWEQFLGELEYFEKYLGYTAVIKGRNLDWRGSNGTKEFILEDTEDICRNLVPRDADFHFDIKKARGKNTYQARCFSHDCPTGSYFNISFRGSNGNNM
jgi:hypothetical protein